MLSACRSEVTLTHGYRLCLKMFIHIAFIVGKFCSFSCTEHILQSALLLLPSLIVKYGQIAVIPSCLFISMNLAFVTVSRVSRCWNESKYKITVSESLHHFIICSNSNIITKKFLQKFHCVYCTEGSFMLKNKRIFIHIFTLFCYILYFYCLVAL